MLEIFMQILVTGGGLFIIGYNIWLHGKQQYRAGVTNAYEALQAGLRTDLSSSDKSKIHDHIHKVEWPSPRSVEDCYIKVGKIHREAFERKTLGLRQL